MPKKSQRILYVQYYSPAAVPPLEHSAHLFSEAGYEVMLLGSRDPYSRLVFTATNGTKVRELTMRAPGWRQKLHYFWFILWTLAWALWWRPDWVYASDLLSCPSGLLLGCLPSVKVIYHEHDSPAPESSSSFMRFCLLARLHLAKRSAVNILPNQERARQFAERVTENRTHVVWNCPLVREATISRPDRSGNELWVLYHGSIVPARLPISVLEALSTLPDTVKLRVVGYETIGHHGYVKELQKAARRLGIEQRVHFINEVPTRADLLGWCRRSDVGLALMPNISDDLNMRNMTGASNKPFDYLACGNALLVSELADWIGMFVKPGFGVSCNPESSESIATALTGLHKEPREREMMGLRGRQRILDEWSYEVQFEPILRLVANAAGTSSFPLKSGQYVRTVQPEGSATQGAHVEP